MKCAYCSADQPELHRDHVVPRSRGGPDNATNIVMACAPCNSAKGSKLASEWLGERCPQTVLLIESKVQAKIERSFQKRDGKAKSYYEAQKLIAEAHEEIASAMWGTLRSPNVCDSNFEPANVVDALASIAKGLFAVAKAIKEKQ